MCGQRCALREVRRFQAGIERLSAARCEQSVLKQFGVSLARSPRVDPSLAGGPERHQLAEVIQHPGPAAAEHLDTLLAGPGRRRPEYTITATDPSAYWSVIVALSGARNPGGGGNGGEHALGPSAQPVREVEHVARPPRMRPPPSTGSFNQWSTATGAETR